MALAALKVGLKVNRGNDNLGKLSQVTKHFDASSNRPSETFWKKWKKRLGYHYRLNKLRLLALRDFDFYYKDNI